MIGDLAYEKLVVDFRRRHLKGIRIHRKIKRWWDGELSGLLKVVQCAR